MKRTRRIVEAAAGIYRLAFWVMTGTSLAAGWLIWQGLRSVTYTHPHHHHLAVAHYHWAGSIGYLLIADLAAFLIWRMAGGITSRYIGLGYDLANVQAVNPAWSPQQTTRYTRTYRRFK